MRNAQFFDKMTSLYFPPTDEADEDGLLAQGGLFELDLLCDAYSHGIFPWPYAEGEPILWFAPPQRGVLFFDELHLPRRFKGWLKNHPYQITFNQAFSDVMKACAQARRKDQQGTWITPAMIRGYEHLFKKGYGQSCEIWDGDNLIAGLYGVFINGVFSGESMFTTQNNGSKLALIAMIEYLKKQGLTWIDTQMTTPVIAQFGGREIMRDEYMKLLKKSQSQFRAET